MHSSPMGRLALLLTATALLSLAGCPTDPATDAGSDAATADAGRDVGGGTDAGRFEPCDGCEPSCADGIVQCVTEGGGSADCSACVPRCGTYSAPVDAIVTCSSPDVAPVCNELSEQALYCFSRAD